MGFRNWGDETFLDFGVFLFIFILMTNGRREISCLCNVQGVLFVILNTFLTEKPI